MSCVNKFSANVKAIINDIIDIVEVPQEESVTGNEPVYVSRGVASTVAWLKQREIVQDQNTSVISKSLRRVKEYVIPSSQEPHPTDTVAPIGKAVWAIDQMTEFGVPSLICNSTEEIYLLDTE